MTKASKSEFSSSVDSRRTDLAEAQTSLAAALASDAASKNSRAQVASHHEVSVKALTEELKALTDVTQVFRSESEEFNTVMKDALRELDTNRWTESDECDAAAQDALDRLNKNQLTENNEFELEHKEWNGVINTMMMNVSRAAGSGGIFFGTMPFF